MRRWSIFPPVLAMAVMAFTGCAKLAAGPDGRPCDNGLCLPGYVCNPSTNICEFLDRDEACMWLGTVQNCSSCGDDCGALPHAATVTCHSLEQSYACVLLTCEPGWSDIDGKTDSGCEAACARTDPSTEICDTLDNDCDGLVDPFCPCDYNDVAVGVCSTASRDSAAVCQIPNNYEASESTCGDSLDNDCDGRVDANCPCDYRGLSTGACRAAILDGVGNCLEPAGFEIAETSCDGIDNDCDGAADVALLQPLASNQNGICLGSIKVCDGASGWIEPTHTGMEGYQLVETFCTDGLDNDCDGLVDSADSQCSLLHRNITVTTGTAAVAIGYSVSVTIDHASWVAAGKSFSDGHDVRVLYGDGVSAIEIDRVIDDGAQWNSANTRIWFSLRAPIAADSADAGYSLHYRRSPAQEPLAAKGNIFVFFDDFESGMGKWTPQIGSAWSVTTAQAHSGSASLRAGEADAVAWITANGVNETDMLLDAYWRLSVVDGVDTAQGVRASSSSPMNQYETNLEGNAGWDIAKVIDGGWSEIVNQSSGQAPAVGVWTKIGSIVVGDRMLVRRNDARLIPNSAWTDVGTELDSGSLGFRIWRIPAGASWWIDNVVARKFVRPEPTTAVGPEEG